MKTLIPALLFLICFDLSASLRYMPKQSAGVSLLPDYGAGIIYSRYLFQHIGLYGSYAHTVNGFLSRRFDSSQKASLGIVYIPYGPATEYPAYFQAGASYNTYKGVAIDKKALKPFDFQIGAGTMIDALSVGFRWDVTKHEASVDIQINFGKKLINPKKQHR